jgi:hypothetical protein
MNSRRKFTIRLLKATLWVGFAAALLIGYGFLPGKIEGNYRGVQCGCDSVNFMRLTDGKILLYSSGHPPAQLIGRYSVAEDGAFDLFLYPTKEGELEKFFARVDPRRFFAKVLDTDGYGTGWNWKRPLLGEARKAFEEQEVEQTLRRQDRSLLKTYYTKNFEFVRDEIIFPKSLKNLRSKDAD